jgi:hypothetical protein
MSLLTRLRRKKNGFPQVEQAALNRRKSGLKSGCGNLNVPDS